MNIAFVSNVVYPFVKGGAEKRIHEVGSRLVRRGHTVTVYGRHYWNGPRETKYQGMTLRGVSPERELYKEERRSITEALEFSADVIRPLRKHINEHDVVVVSGFPYFPVLSSKMSTLLNNTPVVTTWHEVWGSYWDEYLGTLAPFGKLVERVTAAVPQHPIAVSGITASQLEQISPSSRPVEVVPNGLDTSQIASISPANDGFDILFAGRLIKDKNVNILLKAFDNVAADCDSTLGIIGDGPQSEQLRATAQGLSHSHQVTFLGFLEEYDDVLAHMHAAEIFASPSTREGFGITFVEAMAADCTVIAADHPDSAASEVIGDAGYLVKPTVADLTETLRQAIEGERPQVNPTKRANQFDWDAIVEQAEETYQKAVNGQW